MKEKAPASNSQKEIEDLPPVVLVVDDDNDARQMVADALSLMPLQIFQASNGGEAIEICRKSLPDLLVLDVMMPGMDGFETCSRIRSIPGADQISILMLTAREGTEGLVSGLASGANDYLRKPFQYQELLARVRAQLRIRSFYRELDEKNIALQNLQEKIVRQERQLLAQEMAGAIAHELGQPLSAILLQAHLLKQQCRENKEGLQSIASIESDARRMQQIVEKIQLVDASQTTAYRSEQKILRTKK